MRHNGFVSEMINLNDPRPADIQLYASQQLLANAARSGIPLQYWTLHTVAEGTVAAIKAPTKIVASHLPRPFAKSLTEYLHDSLSIRSEIINDDPQVQEHDQVSVVLSSPRERDSLASADLARWYLEWHLETPLIDEAIRPWISEFLDLLHHEHLVFRGEPKQYPTVGSTLYRRYGLEDAALIAQAESALLRIARTYAQVKDNLELQATIQHYGGKSNLIDFTASVWVALFFACHQMEHRDEQGRLMALNLNDNSDLQMHRESKLPEIANRMLVQRSVLVSPPTGVLRITRFACIIDIPSGIKRPLLAYLRQIHDIHVRSLFPDIHGFIQEQEEYLSYHELLEAGYASSRHERHHEALRYFDLADMADQRAPFQGQTEAAKALTYLKMGDDKNAMKSAESAIALLHNSRMGALGTAYLVKAIVHFENGQRGAARCAATLACEHAPTSGPNKAIAEDLLRRIQSPIWHLGDC